MDWKRLDAIAARILEAMMVQPYPLEAEGILALINQNRPDWRDDVVEVALSYQAFEVLDLLGLVVAQDGLNRQVTERGRHALRARRAILTDLFASDPRLSRWEEEERLRAAVSRFPIGGENGFSRLKIRRWRQFHQIDINFHPRLTVLTGANGAGKTTLLNVLASHFSWTAQLITASSAKASFPESGFDVIGQLDYSNGVRATLHQQTSPGVHIGGPTFQSQQSVAGIFIASHRSISGYQELRSLPSKFSSADVLLTQFASEIQNRYAGHNGPQTPLYQMKEALVAAAIYGYGNSAVRANPEAREIWEGFQVVLRELLPSSLAFDQLSVIDSDLYVETLTSQFPIEAVSGGISAMLELAWQIYLRGRNAESFTVCIDEPENHLHPELQRSVIPALLDAFPRARFIVATHSPFVVTSTRDSHVYALSSDAEGLVSSRQIADLNSAATSDETLMAVLGLDSALPLWAEQKVSAALAELSEDPTAAELRSFRSALIDAGLKDQFPAAIEVIRSGGYLD